MTKQPGQNPRPPEVVVYSRAGCHLCEVVIAQLEDLRTRAEFSWRVVDVDRDPELAARYGEQVPVVCIDARKAFKYRLDEQAFLRKLHHRRPGAGSEGRIPVQP